MSQLTKFSSITNNHAQATAALPPLLVRQSDKLSRPSSRRHDDRLPFMIHAGEVVVIDGNHGHDHIDLRGYDVQDALFQGDTIEINKGQANHFVIQFKNVRKAVFSGNVSVDL